MDLFIVTGASAGIGAALARRLATRPDTTVVGIARSAAPSVTVQADLARPAGIDTAAAAVRAAVAAAEPRLAVLVNNAATLDPMAVTGSGELTAQAVTAALTLNVAAPIVLADAFVAATPRATRRMIVNISSGAAKSAYPGWVVYGASKAALDHVTTIANVDLAEVSPAVVVTAIAPGVVDTAMQTHIRATDAARFPRVDRFHALHSGGHLADADAIAAKLVEAIPHLRAGVLTIDQL